MVKLIKAHPITMAEETWTTISKPKRIRPICLDEEVAKGLEKTLKIAHLKEALLSDESRKLQAIGWKYDRVIKGDDPDFQRLHYDPECVLLDIKNKWNDVILFTKKL